MDYLGVCCIAKDEDYYIEEWVKHHLLIGADKIIIFDNASKKPLREILAQYINADLVHLYEVAGSGRQIHVYHHCLQEYKDLFKWIAFIDADEFLIPKEYDDIRLTLTDYEQYGGLGVHWVEFGSSGHLGRPSPSQLLNYTQRFPLDHLKNMHIKSIIQPKRTSSACDPHCFQFKDNWHCVDENYFPLQGPTGPFTNEKIQLNHYYYRSEEDYYLKITRGRADRTDEEGKRRFESFFPQLCQANIHDNSAIQYGKIASKFKSGNEIKEYKSNRSYKEENISVYSMLIEKCIREKNFNHADFVIKNLLANGTDKNIINYFLCKKAKSQKDYHGVIKYCSEIIKNENNYEILMTYARAKYKTGQYKEAKKIYMYIRYIFHASIQEDEKQKKYIDNRLREIEKIINDQNQLL